MTGYVGAIMGGGWNRLELWSMMGFLTSVVEPSVPATAGLVALVSVLHVECQHIFNTTTF